MPPAPATKGVAPPAPPPTETPKLSDIAYARIAASIANGDYAVGGKLPTENELADLMAVSRPIVREALSRLRNDGMVVSRRGSGTYVRRVPLAADRQLAPLSSIADMRRCLDYRISMEGENAYHAALALTDEGRAALGECLARLEQDSNAGEISIDDDFNFHMAVARATENRFFVATMAAMREPIMAGMNITRNFAFLRTHERLLELHQEHVAIHDAVVARDAPGARDAMRRHLENGKTRAFDGTLA